MSALRLAAGTRAFGVQASASLCALWLLWAVGINAKAQERCPSAAELLSSREVVNLTHILGPRSGVNGPLCSPGFVEVTAAGKPLCTAGPSAQVMRIGVQIRPRADQAIGASFIVRTQDSTRDLAADVVGAKLVDADLLSVPSSLRRFVETAPSVGLFQTADGKLIVNARSNDVEASTLNFQVFSLASFIRQDAEFVTCMTEYGFFR
jgi:hypothetical protein